jgi:hypothetical protein
MFEKEIILKEQLAARGLFQCSPARKLLASVGALEFLWSGRCEEIDFSRPTDFQVKKVHVRMGVTGCGKTQALYQGPTLVVP